MLGTKSHSVVGAEVKIVGLLVSAAKIFQPPLRIKLFVHYQPAGSVQVCRCFFQKLLSS